MTRLAAIRAIFRNLSLNFPLRNIAASPRAQSGTSTSYVAWALRGVATLFGCHLDGPRIAGSTRKHRAWTGPGQVDPRAASTATRATRLIVSLASFMGPPPISSQAPLARLALGNHVPP